MKTLVFVLALFFVFSVKAQYVQPGGHIITTEELNLRAQQLTQQCVYLHMAALGCTVLGVALITTAVASSAGNMYSNPNAGLVTLGSLALVAAPILGIVEWIKVAHAHSILSLGNPKLSFNSSPNGIGLAYNF